MQLSPAVTRAYARFGVISGLIFVVLLAVGFLGLAHFYDPAAASWTPAHLHHFYTSRATANEIGLSLTILGTCFLAMWSIQLAMMLWRLEGRWPLMALGELLGGFAVVMLIIISCCLWIGCGFRPGSDPGIAVALNDTSWFGFLLGWVVLSLQMACTAAVTIHDHRDVPLVPRWLSKATFVGAAGLIVANGAAFTKTGVFDFNGVLGYYVPMVIWGLWLLSHIWCMWAAVRRDEAAAVDAASTPAAAANDRVPELATM